MSEMKTLTARNDLVAPSYYGGFDPAYADNAGWGVISIISSRIDYIDGGIIEPIDNYQNRGTDARQGHIIDEVKNAFKECLERNLPAGTSYDGIGIEGFMPIKDHEEPYRNKILRLMHPWSKMMDRCYSGLSEIHPEKPNLVHMYGVADTKGLIAFNKRASKAVIADHLEVIVEGDIERVEGHHITDAVAVAVISALQDLKIARMDEIVLDFTNFDD